MLFEFVSLMLGHLGLARAFLNRPKLSWAGLGRAAVFSSAGEPIGRPAARPLENAENSNPQDKHAEHRFLLRTQRYKHTAAWLIDEYNNNTALLSSDRQSSNTGDKRQDILLLWVVEKRKLSTNRLLIRRQSSTRGEYDRSVAVGPRITLTASCYRLALLLLCVVGLPRCWISSIAHYLEVHIVIISSSDSFEKGCVGLNVHISDIGAVNQAAKSKSKRLRGPLVHLCAQLHSGVAPLYVEIDALLKETALDHIHGSKHRNIMKIYLSLNVHLSVFHSVRPSNALTI